ncbi:putative gustatory receptor 28b [Cryptotermes secundus]|uniref:putative gustatory receptor 28b n=1 Tax=Cryptotermes secundus TaxID=105785 RepID=UPI001454BA13|nr:putative gustatory receptor 28b [Cryptotermes secundus]
MDIYSALCPLLWSSRVLGLAPISIKRGSKLHQLQSSFKILLYSVFMAAVTMTLSPPNRTSHNTYYMYCSLYVCLLNAIQIIGTVAAFAFTAEEANRTGVIVHSVLTEMSQSFKKRELKEFSLQLLHRKLQFTACDFFPLDFTLLHSMIGAVTTYLVIVTQLQLSNPNGIF